MDSSDLKEIILAIVGSITSITSIIVNKYSPEAINKIFFRILLGTGIALLFLAITLFAWKHFTKPIITIISHNEGTEVNPTETIEGQCKNIPSKAKIWVAVYSHNDQRYYPHLTNSTIENDGKWVASGISIGSSADSKKKFDIMLLLLNEKNVTEFQNYINNIDRHGLATLPQEIKIIKRITVTRR